MNEFTDTMEDAAEPTEVIEQEPVAGEMEHEELPEVEQTGVAPDSDEPPSLSELRAFAGVVQPQLPSNMAQAWDEGMESEFLQYGIDRNIPAVTLQRILEWNADWYCLREARITPAEERNFRQYAKDNGLPDADADRLVNWVKGRRG